VLKDGIDMIELVMRKFFACLSLARKYALIVIVMLMVEKKSIQRRNSGGSLYLIFPHLKR